MAMMPFQQGAQSNSTPMVPFQQGVQNNGVPMMPFQQGVQANNVPTNVGHSLPCQTMFTQMQQQLSNLQTVIDNEKLKRSDAVMLQQAQAKAQAKSEVKKKKQAETERKKAKTQIANQFAAKMMEIKDMQNAGQYAE